MPPSHLPNPPPAPYPIKQVIVRYLVACNLIAPALVALGVMVFTLKFNPFGFVAMYIGAALFSFLVGAIPALMCGILAACCRLRRNVPGLAAAALTGAAVGWLFAFLTHQVIRVQPYEFALFIGLCTITSFFSGFAALPHPDPD